MTKHFFQSAFLSYQYSLKKTSKTVFKLFKTQIGEAYNIILQLYFQNLNRFRSDEYKKTPPEIPEESSRYTSTMADVLHPPPILVYPPRQHTNNVEDSSSMPYSNSIESSICNKQSPDGNIK